MAGSINNRSVNFGGARPVQGFDVGLFWYDRSDNSRVMVGQATSMVITIRNATEAYTEFGQRYPAYLDGEIQIAYVIERGLIDLRVFQQTFGFKRMARDKRFGRSPRFDIVFAVNPVDADAMESVIADQMDNTAGASFSRDVTGRIILENCKVDSWHLAATAGRHVIATQWQGIAEGIDVIVSDYSIINGLESPNLTNGGQDVGASFRKYADGVASTNPAFQADADYTGAYPPAV